ncbi:tetratricopeptide repeat protein [Actinoplanes sp. NBRC 103695]|uniref:tetratricopeptide repeat protein n=1 Tax=Actinoplanes sp. NBRC 103695 TaxID=3032202 RepID=UPI0024A018EA|nr:tetratricopeptide repeat protein [Actinoplanes sp. NBRC 103695]GLY95460.1 hypothetical protein Acsp02_27150 [Actinoplanes sp. NBRC 103695]
MTTSNQITDGVFFSSVVMGRDVRVVLPAEVRPALTGLPPPTTVFTGRDEQVELLLSALRPGREAGALLVSAVAGMGGVGKTELVLHVADRALRWFSGGVLFVDMFGYDPERRLSAGDALLGWLQAVGVPGEHIPASEQDRSRLWRSVLDAYVRDDRRLLLIIDNVADEGQVRPLLPTDARVPVLITSRHTLDLDARLHDLDTLDVAAAVALIREVIAGRRGPADPRLSEPADSLAEVCAGLPLALRIVAALLADRPRLTPDELAGQLRADDVRLDALARQQSAVRATFDLSYRQLAEDQARLFRLLPLNPGPDIATAAASVLAGVGEDVLADLHRAHLIEEPVAGRWRMHDLVRLYAATLPSPDGPEARERLYRFYVSRTQAATRYLWREGESPETEEFPERDAALAWLDAEHRNLVSVCVTAHHQRLPEISWELALALGRFLDVRRHNADAIATAMIARDLGERRDDLHEKGVAWNLLGLALMRVRRLDESIAMLSRARAAFRETGDVIREANSLSNLGGGLRAVGRTEEAVVALTEADEKFRSATGGHPTGGHASNNLGGALRELGRIDESITAHERARDVFRQLGDEHGEAQAWNALGITFREAGRVDEALAAHLRARDVFRAFADRHREAVALCDVGTALVRAGRAGEAHDYWAAAAEAFAETGEQDLAEVTRGWIDELRQGQ